MMLAGCAADGDFPSLAVRAVEREPFDPEPVRTPPPVAREAALLDRVRALGAEARSGDAAFAAEMAAAETATGRAGTSGSEGWIVAQEAVSRAEAARGATVTALAALDALALERAAMPTNQDDFALLLAEAEAVRMLAEAQHRRLATVRARLQPS